MTLSDAAHIIFFVDDVQAYYWLVHAMLKLDCLELAKNEIAQARKNLTNEEFATLKKLFLMDSSLPHAALFGAE